jgi:hypothetical protein
MQEFGSLEERQAARKVAEACKALNDAIFAASFLGVNVKIIDLEKEWESHSNLQVARMEHRRAIVPASS